MRSCLSRCLQGGSDGCMQVLSGSTLDIAHEGAANWACDIQVSPFQPLFRERNLLLILNTPTTCAKELSPTCFLTVCPNPIRNDSLESFVAVVLSVACDLDVQKGVVLVAGKFRVLTVPLISYPGPPKLKIADG